jgi:hypothetical protein
VYEIAVQTGEPRALVELGLAFRDGRSEVKRGAVVVVVLIAVIIAAVDLGVDIAVWTFDQSPKKCF